MDVSRQTRNVTSVRLPRRVKSFGPTRYWSDGVNFALLFMFTG